MQGNATSEAPSWASKAAENFPWWDTLAKPQIFRCSNLPKLRFEGIGWCDDGWIRKNHVFFVGKISTTSGIDSFFSRKGFFLGGGPIQWSKAAANCWTGIKSTNNVWAPNMLCILYTCFRNRPDTQQKNERIGLQWKGWSILYFNSNIVVTPCSRLTKCQEGTAQRKGLAEHLATCAQLTTVYGFFHVLTCSFGLTQVDWSTLESAEKGCTSPSLQRSHAALPGPCFTHDKGETWSVSSSLHKVNNMKFVFQSWCKYHLEQRLERVDHMFQWMTFVGKKYV